MGYGGPHRRVPPPAGDNEVHDPDRRLRTAKRPVPTRPGELTYVDMDTFWATFEEPFLMVVDMDTFWATF